MGRERNEKGRYSEETPPEKLLAIFENHEPLTTKEVAEKAGIPKRTAYEKLVQLSDREDVKRKDIGELATVWYI